MSDAIPQPVTMTAEQIGAMTPEQVGARRTAMLADPEWREKYLKGDVAARTEFTEVHKRIAAAVDVGGVQARQEQEDHLAAHLQEHAFVAPEIIQQIRERRAVSQEEYRMARAAKARIMSDKAAVRKYLDGDAELRSRMVLINVILSSQVTKKG